MTFTPGDMVMADGMDIRMRVKERSKDVAGGWVCTWTNAKDRACQRTFLTGSLRFAPKIEAPRRKGGAR